MTERLKKVKMKDKTCIRVSLGQRHLSGLMLIYRETL